MGEIAFENAAVDRAAELGWIQRKMTYIGRRGCPDRWFFRDGVVKIIEFKAPNGSLSPVQIREIRKLRKAGIVVNVVSTMSHLETVLA